MMAITPHNYSLPGVFDQFYQAIGDIKQALATALPDASLATLFGNASPIKPGDQAACISGHLQQLLESQEKQVARFGTASDIQAYDTAKYMMVALADELFLIVIKWQGQEDWLNHLLEQRLFGTSFAGDHFFYRLDQLLKNNPRRAHDEELAAIALLALRLGFHGRYRQDGKAVLARYRSRLYRLVGNGTGNASNADRTDDQKLFPAAYQNPLSPPHQARLAPLSKWHRISIVAITAHLVISSLLWSVAVAPITRFLQG